MTVRQKTPPGYIRIGKRYVLLAFMLTLSFSILALAVLYAAALHPVVMQKWFEMQSMPEFGLDSPYLAGYAGSARLILPDGTLLYEGTVESAAANGEGRLYENGALIYEGGFASNEFSGSGRLYDGGVLIYEGGFESNMRSGKGKLFAPDGTVLYEGDFESDEMSGQGRMFENGAVTYSGGFLEGKYSGAGKLYDSGGRLRYEGDFLAGLYDGKGRLYENGALIYEGEFTAGEYNGTGTQYNAETGHPVFSGRYLEGIRMEAGVVYDENGEPVVLSAEPAPRPEPLSLLGRSYSDVISYLAQAEVAVKEQAAGIALFVLDEEACVIYSFGLLEDGTPDYLSRIYYYGLASVDGVVVGADILDISGGINGTENLSAAELLVLGYSNAKWGRDAESSKLKNMTYGGGGNYTVTAFYLPPEPIVIPERDAAEDFETEDTETQEIQVIPVTPPEPSGRILFLRVDYTSK